MRLRTLLAATLILAVASVPGARGQSIRPTTRGRDGLTASAPLPWKSSYLGKKATTRSLPPAPRIPNRASRAAASRPLIPGLVGTDDSGRRDLAGRSVPFYPSVRGRATGTMRSPIATDRSSGYKPRENANRAR